MKYRPRPTRHKQRLDRDFGRKRSGDDGYAMECRPTGFNAGVAGLRLFLDHAAQVLKQDKRAIFSAASHAQRAARLNGLQLQKEARAA